MSIRAIAVVALSTCCISAAIAGQTIVENKVTPGKVALLVQPKSQADVTLLGTVLDHSDPAVRALAARIAGLLGRRDLAPALLELLEREPKAFVAAEQVRALLYLRGQEILPQSKAAATRLGAAVGAEVAEWLGRTDPPQLGATLPQLLGNLREPDKLMFASIAAMAVRQTPAARDSIAASLAASASGRAWREFLNRLDTVDAKVIESGLASPDPAVREVTMWFVLGDASKSRAVQLADLKPALAALRADDTEWAAFGREVIERRMGKPAVIDGSDLIKRQAATERSAAMTLASVPELTTPERAALREVAPDAQASRTVDAKKPAAIPAAETKPVNFRVRTFPAIAPGVLDSLVEALSCKLPSNQADFGAARIFYQRDGRPREIAIDTTTLTPACAPFVDYLARLTLAQPDQPILDDVSIWWVMAMDKAVIGCAGDEWRLVFESGAAEPIGGQIRVPHKIQDVRPVYPEAMRLARISGIVVIQATITATGCISNAEVLRSIQLPMDIAALRAVSGWRFEPTLLNGIPVPVVMTVTVNFTLK
jgi:TonB family protein